MPASFFGLLPSHDHLAEDVHGDHGERQQNGGSPPGGREGHTAEHIADPAEYRHGDQGSVDDERLHQDDDNEHPHETGVQLQILKDVKAVAAHVEGVEQGTPDEQHEIGGELLLRAGKEAVKERHFQEDKAQRRQPQAHGDDLGHHGLADNALIPAAGRLGHIPLLGGLIAQHDGAQAVHASCSAPIT